MKRFKLLQQLQEVLELREQLQSPISALEVSKPRGLRIVSMPVKNDTSLQDFQKQSREYRQRIRRRAEKKQENFNSTLASKLQGFKVA